jgi:hypothetical protein
MGTVHAQDILVSGDSSETTFNMQRLRRKRKPKKVRCSIAKKSMPGNIAELKKPGTEFPLAGCLSLN